MGNFNPMWFARSLNRPINVLTLIEDGSVIHDIGIIDLIIPEVIVENKQYGGGSISSHVVTAPSSTVIRSFSIVVENDRLACVRLYGANHPNALPAENSIEIFNYSQGFDTSYLCVETGIDLSTKENVDRFMVQIQNKLRTWDYRDCYYKIPNVQNDLEVVGVSYAGANISGTMTMQQQERRNAFYEKCVASFRHDSSKIKRYIEKSLNRREFVDETNVMRIIDTTAKARWVSPQDRTLSEYAVSYVENAWHHFKNRRWNKATV